MTGRGLRFIALLALALAGCTTTVPPVPSGSPAQPFPPTPSSVPSRTATDSPSLPPPTGWHRLTQAEPSPSAREDHTWTVSADGRTAYLFGGRDTAGQVLDDLWAYDLPSDRWRRVTVANGPPARFGHNASWVDGIGLVIFAGQGPTTFHDDLWAFEPGSGQWRQLPNDGAAPVARYGSCAALGPDGRLWISHGFTSEGSRFADTRAYDFTTMAWTDETPAGERPVERCLHACWWTGEGSLALYGGQTTGVPALGDLWLLTPGRRIGTNTWSQPELPRRWPAERQLYAAARWGSGTVIFGGGSLAGGYLDDAWLIADSGETTRLVVGAAPAARSGAELIADPTRGRLLLFGGRDAQGAMRDTWELRLPPS